MSLSIERFITTTKLVLTGRGSKINIAKKELVVSRAAKNALSSVRRNQPIF
jgi:hypothetical protein